jgi:hypothetical protein
MDFRFLISSVTRRTVCDALNVVFLNQLAALLLLIRGRCPGHTEDLVPGPNEPLRVPVAVETPTHVESVDLSHQGHLVNLPVAGGASDTLLYMDAVVEVDKVGKIVNSPPLQRLPGAVAVANRLEDGSVGPHLRVTGHAGVSGRDSCRRTLFNRGVAVTAIDTQAVDVMLVTEHHRLLPELVNPVEI